MSVHRDLLTDKVIGLAITVHRELGPGLLEKTYERCLCHELELNGLRFAHQVELPILYKGIRLEGGYRMDLVVEDELVLELKCADSLLPIHEAQLLTYLRLSGLRRGLLLNFRTAVLKNGIRRLVL